MAFNSVVVPFTLDSTATAGSSTLSITSSGFGTPTAAMFFCVGAVGDDSFTNSNGATQSIGATDGTNERCSAVNFQHGTSGTPGASRINFTDGRVIHISTQSTTSGAADGYLSFDAWITDGVRLLYNNAPGANYRGFAILFTGTDNAKVQSISAPSSGTSDITSVGFQPDIVFNFQTGTGETSSSSATAPIWLGCTTRNTADNTGTNVCATFGWPNTSQAQANGYLLSSSCASHMSTGGTISRSFSISSFDSSGFSVSHDSGSASGSTHSVLSLKLPTGVVASCGVDDGPETTSTDSFSPVYADDTGLVLAASVHNVSINAGDGSCEGWSIGAYDGTTHACVSTRMADPGTTIAESLYKSGRLTKVPESASIVSETHVTSMTGSTVGYTWDTQVSGYNLMWIAIQADSVAGGDTLTADPITSAVPVVDSVALSQKHALTATDITSAVPVVDSVALSQKHALSHEDITAAVPVVDSVALSQSAPLTADPIDGGVPVVDSVTLSQKHALPATDITSVVPVVDSVSLSQKHALSHVDITSAVPVVDSVTLSLIGGLPAAPITGGIPVVDSVALSQRHDLSADPIDGGIPVVDIVAVAQKHALSHVDITSAVPVVDSIALSQRHNLAHEDITAEPPELSAGVVLQDHLLSHDDITSAAPLVDSVGVSTDGTDALAADPIDGGIPVVDSAALSQKHLLQAEAITSAVPAVDSVPIAQHNLLAAQDIFAGIPVVDIVTLTESELVELLAEDIFAGIPVVDSVALATAVVNVTRYRVRVEANVDTALSANINTELRAEV